MSLVQNVQDALTRVATEVKALKTVDQGLAQALLDLDTAVTALENRIFISATAPGNPVEGMIWLDTSGV